MAKSSKRDQKILVLYKPMYAELLLIKMNNIDGRRCVCRLKGKVILSFL